MLLVMFALAGASGAGAASASPAPAAAKPAKPRAPTADEVARSQLLHKQADVLERDGRNHAALPLYRQAEALDPTSPQNAKSLGRCLARMGKFGEAAVYYRRFLQLAPNDPDADTIRQGLQEYDATR